MFLPARACWSLTLMACPRRSFCQRKAWRCPGRFHSTPGTAAWASRFTGRPADANASPPTPPAPSHDQPTRHGKQHAASRSACRDNNVVHKAPNEHLPGTEDPQSLRNCRPVVVGCRSVHFGTLGIPSGRAQPTKRNHFRSQGLPSLLCSSSSGAQPFCMQIPVTACHR